MSKNLVFDITNLLYRTFHANKNLDEITTAGLSHHVALTTLNKYFKIFKPDRVVMAFDRSSWRKKYTAGPDCISGKPYKGNRRKDMTPTQKERFEKFLEHLAEFEELMTKHTSIVCLAGDGLEADDLVAGWVQAVPDEENVIVSGDKDMIQLLRNPNVRLVDPATGKDRSLAEWNGDADLFMHEKILRGDTGDNVQAAYPRIRKTRIMKTYEDAFERLNMMKEVWTDQDGKEIVVEDIYNENKLLMDLTAQPADIKRDMFSTILAALDDPGSYNHMKFLRFCGRFELKNISKNLEQYVQMLSR